MKNKGIKFLTLVTMIALGSCSSPSYEKAELLKEANIGNAFYQFKKFSSFNEDKFYLSINRNDSLIVYNVDETTNKRFKYKVNMVEIYHNDVVNRFTDTKAMEIASEQLDKILLKIDSEIRKKQVDAVEGLYNKN